MSYPAKNVRREPDGDLTVAVRLPLEMAADLDAAAFGKPCLRERETDDALYGGPAGGLTRLAGVLRARPIGNGGVG